MKYFLLICLLSFTHFSFADEKILELNAENLTLLALKNSSDDILNNYAFHILKTKKIIDYFKFRKDKVKIKELIKRERKLIDATLNNIPKKQKFKLSQRTAYKKYNDNLSQMNLNNIFQGNFKSLFRAEDSFEGLPNYFFLLISNIELQNNININKERFERRHRHLKSISQIYNKNIYTEYILSFEKFQNQQDFQVVIDRIDIYTSSNKKTILGTAIEKQSHSKLTNNWLLSEGYTNPLVGIHAFQFSHNRLQDQLISASALKSSCEKTIDIKEHVTIVCTKPFTAHSDIIVNYLGGKVAQIDLVSHGQLTKQEISKIQNAIKIYLKLPKLTIDYNVVKWSDFNVDFTMYSDAFNHKTSKRSNYTNIFDIESTNSNQPDKTLVISMMAHNTVKLLTDLGVKL